jgi:hypothetical protein
MKILLVAAAAFSRSPHSGNAEDYSKAPKPYVKGHVGGAKRDPGNKRQYPDANGWYLHDSSKLAFGSAIWWEQMQREGRLSGNVQ